MAVVLQWLWYFPFSNYLAPNRRSDAGAGHSCVSSLARIWQPGSWSLGSDLCFQALQILPSLHSHLCPKPRPSCLCLSPWAPSESLSWGGLYYHFQVVRITWTCIYTNDHGYYCIRCLCAETSRPLRQLSTRASSGDKDGISLQSCCKEEAGQCVWSVWLCLADSMCCRGVCSYWGSGDTLGGGSVHQLWTGIWGWTAGQGSTASRWEHEGTCEARCGGWRVVGWGPSELPHGRLDEVWSSRSKGV